MLTSMPSPRQVAATSAPMNPAPTTATRRGRRHQRGADGRAVVEGAQRVHPVQVVGARQALRRRARGDHETVVRKLLAAGQEHRARPARSSPVADSPRRQSRSRSSSVPRPTTRVVDSGGFDARQHLLRQRRPVVGPVRLVADDRDRPVVAQGAQLLGGPQPGERGPDDDDAVEAHRPWVSPRS